MVLPPTVTRHQLCHPDAATGVRRSVKARQGLRQVSGHRSLGTNCAVAGGGGGGGGLPPAFAVFCVVERAVRAMRCDATRSRSVIIRNPHLTQFSPRFALEHMRARAHGPDAMRWTSAPSVSPPPPHPSGPGLGSKVEGRTGGVNVWKGPPPGGEP
ncbi:hypothetical protein BJV74DRAFT_793068 [Russula compacta]|nr:hypothetical protein BJV74DRAFT_793068 [Russula compacta]